MKKNKVLMTFVILITIIIGISTVDVKAVDTQYNVKRYDEDGNAYTDDVGDHRGEPLKFNARINNKNYYGTCVDIKGHITYTPGNATCTVISHDTTDSAKQGYLKIGYEWGLKQGWYSNTRAFRYWRAFYRTMQWVRGGEYATEANSYINAWENSDKEYKRIAYQNATTIKQNYSSVNVPDSFTMYFCNNDSGSQQDFVLWDLPFQFNKTYNGTAVTNGTPVKVGDTISYKIHWTGNWEPNWDHNDSEPAVSVITDTVTAGLKFTGTPQFVGAAGADSDHPGSCQFTENNTKMTCTVNAFEGDIIYTAQVTDAAKALTNPKVCNNATATHNGETKTTPALCNPVPSKSYTAGSDNPGIEHKAVKIGQQIKYTIKYVNTSTTSQVVKISDTLSGMKYVQGSSSHEANLDQPLNITNPKWTITVPGNTPLTLTYLAEVTDAVKATQYKACNSASITAGGKTVELDDLCNPVPEKEYAETSATNPGYGGVEVLMPDKDTGREGDDIKYKIALPNVTGQPQTITVTDVLSKGLTLNTDDAKKPKVTENGTLGDNIGNTKNENGQTTLIFTVTVEPNSTAVLEYSAKVNDEAANNVCNSAQAAYPGSTVTLDKLCNNVPKKKYDVDTPSGMNGKMVQEHDIIRYNVSYSNGFVNGATVNLRDTLSKGLTYTPGTAKICNDNKADCKAVTDPEAHVTENVVVKTDGTTEIYWTRSNMSFLTTEIIVYEVTVTGETIWVENHLEVMSCKEETAINKTVTFTEEQCKEQLNPNCEDRCNPLTDKNCKPATDNECTKTKQECSFSHKECNGVWKDIEKLRNPEPKKQYNEKTPSGFDQSAVAKGNIIRYEIKYKNVEEKPVTITIKDTISKGIEYRPGSSKINGEKIPDPKLSKDRKTLTWVRKNVAKDVEESLTYEVLVTGETTEVVNKACMIYSNHPDYERCLTRLRNPVPQKTYAKNTPKGANGAVVKKNDIIRYSIKYSNVKDTSSSVIIMDHLSKGLKYQKGSAKVNGKKVQEISVTENSNGTIVVWMKEIAKKTKEELTYDVKVTGTKKLVENNASIQFDDDPMIKLDELRNPLLPGTQVIKVPNTASQLAIAGIVAGTVLVGAGGYLIYRRYKNV